MRPCKCGEGSNCIVYPSYLGCGLRRQGAYRRYGCDLAGPVEKKVIRLPKLNALLSARMSISGTVLEGLFLKG